jgi:hypothetical protein
MKFTVTLKKVNIMSTASANVNQENGMQNVGLEIFQKDP